MGKILIIDDEPAITMALSMSLSADGHDVVSASDGLKGLDILKKEKPDIILADLKMPGIDGLEVLKRAKQMDDDVEVIIITGHGDIDAAIEALKFGASDFLNKPVQDAALEVAIKRANEKLTIKRKLAEHTSDLENMVSVATEEIKRKSIFESELIENSHEGIVATDIDGTIITFNPSAEKIFGYARRDVIASISPEDIYPPALKNAFYEKKELDWIESVITAKDGMDIPVKVSGKILRVNQNIIGTVAFFQDIREIKKLEGEVLRSEKLAAVGQTVAGMAHCVKNILHGFNGGSYLMDIGLDKNDMDKIRYGWKTVTRNIDRMSDLVMDLLSYAKDRRPDYECCSPNGIMEDVFETMSYKAIENGVEIVKEFDPFIGEVWLDRLSIRRAMMNLFSNAIDACIFDEADDKKWRVELKTASGKGDRILFIIKDNGSGMDDDVKKQLFTSFFSTKGAQGTGLGLLVTRKLVEEHHGSIDVESALGKGSTVTVAIPCKKGAM